MALHQIESGFAAVGAMMMPMLDTIGNVVEAVSPKYWAFLNRGFGLTSSKPFLEVYPNFWVHCVYSTLFFCSAFILVPHILAAIAPKWLAGLPSHKARDLPGYIVCLMHHVVVVPFVAYSIYIDTQRTAVEAAVHDYRTSETMAVPMLVGYLMGDLFCNTLLSLQWEYIIHHCITLFLTVQGTFALPNYTQRFIPHLLLCDSTQLSYNIAWILRLTPLAHLPVAPALELTFVFFFFFTRVINMPLCFLVEAQHDAAIGMGLGRFTFLPLALMQFFWFYKVILTVRRTLSAGTLNKQTGKKKAQ